ncbi:restriction endonuclease subunit S [Enterobacter hormaechei subsp. steigerwaltii]
MVPKGWEKNSLDSLFEFKNGLNTEKEQYGNGYKFVNVMDVFRNDILTESKIIGRVQVTDKQLEGYQLKYGDVLFNRTSETFDEIAIAAIYLDNAIATFGGFVIRARPKGNQIDPAYSVFLFQSKSYRSQVVKLGQGAIRANIGQKDLARVCILVPPLAEQKKIAQILSTWDKAISVTEKLLTNSLQQKQALMQQLLTGKKRLLDENGVRFSTEWEFKRISEIATRVQRKNDAAEHPILTISSLSGFVRQDERYSRYMAGESVKNYILLKKGEFAYNKGNSKTYEFGCIFDLEAYEAGLVPHVYVCFRLKNGLSHRYFKYLFEADYLKPQLGALVNTGVRNNGLLNIKPTEFMQTKVPVPCFEEQESIADMLYNSSRTIRVLQDKLACLKDEKKALMQQLLTGKRRVKVDEAVAV